MFPDFDNMDYLSGGVGTGNLTDDILDAMHDVLIYIRAGSMPRGYRPGTITGSGRRALCETWTEDGTEPTIFGISTREWVSICRDVGDDLTLLHGLFHYAATAHNDDELRAYAISMCAYGM